MRSQDSGARSHPRASLCAALVLSAAAAGVLVGAAGCPGATAPREAISHEAEPDEVLWELPAPPEPDWSRTGCTAEACHAGIEAIRGLETGMMRAIRSRGEEHGDPDGCVVCHGGHVDAVTATVAHTGTSASLAAAGGPDDFFPDPASPWVNARSCGQCHMELVAAQWNSLMMTEAGKVQGTTWSFGALEGYEHGWANYDANNPEDPHARLGTDAYRAYMVAKTEAHPNVFVDAMTAMPEAPGDAELSALAGDPREAVFTYIRTECQRCHLGVKGRQRRGDYRGMGCGACHLPYGNEGLYEGGDQTIPGDEPGHALVHSIQATRDAAVFVHEEGYTGIPVETCTTCHNRGKRIGVSYQGLMESAWDTPYTEGGGGQLGLHTKHYIAMEQDVHYQRGMLCQDCHTSGDVHGDRFLTGSNLGAIEIECTDCHGTPTAYPWELPLGWGDEDGVDRAPFGGDRPRGVGERLPAHLRRGEPAPARDGYILTARGNPMPEIVRVGRRVLVNTAAGKQLWLEPLKKKRDDGSLSPEAEVAMVQAHGHIESMECYACHSSWAPQCYGCHVKIDYSAEAEAFDWVRAGQRHQEPAHRRDRGEQGYPAMIPGEVVEKRSYLRWEDPALGVNGEGRVSPIVPGCQVSATIIGPDGEEIVRNKLFRTPPHSEGGGPEGQIGVDMSPLQPHTVGKARSCESCHGSRKAMGYGIGGTAPWGDAKVVDLMTADGRVIPGSARAQIEAIEGLEDWSAVLSPEGEQLMTVGHHFEASGPLTAAQRERLDRQNVCVGCHVEIPDGSLAVSVLHHIGSVGGWQLPDTPQEHAGLVNKIVLGAAWAQVGGGLLGGVGLTAGIVLLIARRRRRRE